MICVYGSLDRAKDASREQERQIMPLSLGACACLVRPLTSFPSSFGSRGHPMSLVRPEIREELLPT
jgi:hypothetical protein